MSFTFLEVKDKNLLEDTFAFRYKVMNTTDIFESYIQDKDFPDDKESDIYDPFSIHFVALNQSSEVCATIRLIHNCPHGYPTEQMSFNKDMFDRDKLGEISRIFIDERYRDFKNTKIIIYNFNKLLYSKLIELNIEYTYGALKSNLIRLLKINKVSYEKLTEMQVLGTMGLRYPCILYTKKFAEDNPEFLQTGD